MEPMVVDILQDVEPNDNSEPGPALRESIVHDANVDVDQLVSNYSGYARYQRLVYIAEHCPALKLEALLMALQFLKLETYDVQSYVECHRKVTAAAQSRYLQQQQQQQKTEAVPELDTEWVESTRRKAQVMLEKLDVELKSSKHSAIKESIRRGQDELAAHYLRMGDLSSALKNYNRTRDYCTNHLQQLDMCINVIRVSVYSCNWQHAKSHITKAESYCGYEAGRGVGGGGGGGGGSGGGGGFAESAAAVKAKPKERENILRKMAFVQAASGLVELADARYRNAARQLLGVQFDMFNYADLLSPANVATYASLCALATFDRQEMRKQLMTSANFRQFLETDPAVRDMVASFHQANYSQCLLAMDRLKSSLLLDLHLGRHVEPLFSEIRKRAITQYFSPYVSADLGKMADTFGTGVPQMEDELMRLILEKRISARIDSNRRLIVAKQADLRSVVFENALLACKEWKRRNSAALLHLAVAKANLSVTDANPSGEIMQ